MQVRDCQVKQLLLGPFVDNDVLDKCMWPKAWWVECAFGIFWSMEGQDRGAAPTHAEIYARPLIRTHIHTCRHLEGGCADFLREVACICDSACLDSVEPLGA